MSDLSQRASSTGRETRTYEFRLAGGGDGRTLEGLAAPYNEPTTIYDQWGQYLEVIRPGAFARTIVERAGRIKLLASHNREAFPLGKVDKLVERREGLHLSSRISNTTAGNDALELVRDGTVTGLSIGFKPVRQVWNEDYTSRELLEVALLEVSLVADPAYAGAGITAVRSATGMSVADALAAMNPPADLRSGLSVALARLANAAYESEPFRV